MSLSNVIIKIFGLVLAFVGLALLLATVGISIFGIGFTPPIIEIILGFLFVGAGVVIVRGGNLTV